MGTIISNIIDDVTNRASRPLTQPDFVIDYYVNGLTYASNDTTILPRDTAGNISIEPSSSNLLVIEPIIDKVTTTSVLKVIDTNFQYYKFPVSVVNSGLPIDLNIADSEEILYTELILPISLDSRNQIQDLDRIDTSYASTWYYGTNNSSGFKSLPFTGGVQPKANGYTITQDAIDVLREKNKTLKFRIQLQFLPRYPRRTSIQIRLNRTNPKAYRNFNQVILYSEGNVGNVGDTVNNPYDFRPRNEYPYFEMEYYVDMNDIVAGDYYFIEAVAGGEVWSMNSNGFWNIEPTNIPVTPGYYGYNSNNLARNSGVYYISENIVLRDANNNDIGIKNVTTNQIFESI
jgi:hypothetical protein